MSNIDDIEYQAQDVATNYMSLKLWQVLVKELREVRAELEALKESKYTVPDGYRVMLIHESE